MKIALNLALCLLCMVASIFAFTIDNPDQILLAPSDVYNMGTLNPYDFITDTWSFYCNVPGSGVQYNQVVNAGSDIRISTLAMFQVGIQAGDVGKIVDLGSYEDLDNQYQCDAKCFTGIEFDKEGNLHIPSRNAVLLNVTMESDSANIRLGHIYLAQILDSRGEKTLLFTKFLVTNVVSAESSNLKMPQSVSFRSKTLAVGLGTSRMMCSSTQPLLSDISIVGLVLSIVATLTSICSLVLLLICLRKKKNYDNIN